MPDEKVVHRCRCYFHGHETRPERPDCAGRDFIVAIGGAVGTLSEICFAWIHNKLILTSLAYPISFRQAHNLNRIRVIQVF